jgi:starch synthase
LSADDRALVTVSGAAAGRNPLDRRSWSGISYRLLTELERQGFLRRAVSAQASPLPYALALARSFSPDREIWRQRLYLDVAYRDALTSGIRRTLEPDDFEHDFLQFAGYYDVPAILPGNQACYAYYDGNLALRLRAPYPFRGVTEAMTDRALEYERRLLREMRLVFTMSEYLRQSFISDYALAPDRVVTIGGGFNLDFVPAYQSGKAYDNGELLFVGIDFPRKGGWVLLEAFRSVLRSHPRARLHVVGPKTLALPKDLTRKVSHHGFLPRSSSTFAELLQRCSLFVMPSLYEPFGIAPLEAMVHQMPAVVTGDWALGETVVPGRTGAHVRPGDAEELGGTISALLDQPNRLREMGDAARERVLESYTWEKVVSRLTAAVRASR